MRRKISAHVNGGRAEGLACADPVARTPIGAIRILLGIFSLLVILAAKEALYVTMFVRLNNNGLIEVFQKLS